MISAHDCPILTILIEIADMTMLTPGRSVLECPTCRTCRSAWAGRQELRFETSEALRQVQDPSALLVLREVLSVFLSLYQWHDLHQ